MSDPQRTSAPGRRPPRSPRPVTTLVVATVGLALNLRAWILLGQHLHGRFGVDAETHIVLMSLPLLVAAVVRLPVGVLTDRYGARVTFPVVSLVAAASVLWLAHAGSVPVAVLAGAGTGVGGAAFVVGGSLLSRAFPYGTRGRCLGVLSLAQAPSLALPAVLRGMDYAGRPAATALAAALVVFAVVAALVLRDPVPARSAGSAVRRCVEMVRLASGTSLSLLYAIALGGVMVLAVYLPVHLSTAYHLSWVRALTVTAGVVAVSGVARLAGGWWTDRRPAAGPLIVCYAIAAGLCLVAAAMPGRIWLVVPVTAAVGVCDGVAGGALLALVGKAVRPDNAGAVMGVTGAVAALGALPPILLTVVDLGDHGYQAAWALLAGVMFTAALYVRGHGLAIGLGLAVRFEPEPGPAATTVAVVGGSSDRYAAPALVARLAELAVSDDLIVVCGSDEPFRSMSHAQLLVTGLRHRLPRYQIVAVRVVARAGTLGGLPAMLDKFVETGAVTIAMTPTGQLAAVTAELSHRLHADRVLQLSYTLSGGAGLREVWNRTSPTATRALRALDTPN